MGSVTSGAARRIAAVSAAGAILLGVLALVGWWLNLPLLTRVSPAYRAISPAAVAALLLLGAVLLRLALGRVSGTARWVLASVAFFVALFGLLDLLGFLVGADLNREDVLTAHLAQAWSLRLQPMSPVAGTLMFLLGASLLTQLLRPAGEGRPRGWLGGDAAGALGAVAVALAAVFVLSYVRGAPLLYGSHTLPIAATSALGFLLLGVGVVAAAGVAHWPLRSLSGDSVRARLLRTIVPLTALAVLVSMVAHEEIPALASMNRALQTALLTVVFTVVAGLVATRIGSAVGGALDRAQAALRESEQSLQQSNEELEVANEELVVTNHQLLESEAALRESEDRLRLAQDIARVGTFDWDLRTNVNTWTPELEAMYGLPPGGFAQTQPAWEELVHAEDRPGALALVKQAFASGEPTEGEWRVVWPDGSLHWLAGRWQVLKDESGAPLRMTGVNIDLTARKQVEEEVARQHALLETVVDNARSQLVYLDRNFNFIWVNQAYAQACQRPRESFPGHNHFELYPNEENEAIFRRARDTGQPVEFLAKPFVFPDHPEWGTTYWDWRLTPLKGETGEVEYFVFSLADVTATVQARERLLEVERARATLAEHISDEISHRVKNNLAMISGLLQMQMLGESDPETAQALREAVGRIRTFAALHEQMYAVGAEQADLLLALERIGAMIGELFAARHEVAISVLGKPFRCNARVATNLSVIANELITNALKHGGPGDDGRRVVEVRLHHTEQDVVLSVWNSGPPAPEDLDPARSGTMGLQLVHSVVVEQYRGRFRLRPSDGGTLAEIIVPGEAIRADSLPR